MPDPTQIYCPACGQPMAYNPQFPGQPLRCSKCGNTVTPGAVLQDAFGMPDVPPTNGFAIASLICGILFCIFPTAVLALVFGILGLNKTKDPRIPGKGMAITGIVLGSIGCCVAPLALMISILLPSLNRARETANRVKCASNEKMIGQAILLYENENQGAYPPDLGTLIKTEDITAPTFVCPDDTAVPPDGMSPDQAATWVNQNSSYVYVGSGLHSGGDPAVVVLYEKETDHNHDGMNLLFADGHVDFDNLATARNLISQANAAKTQ